MSLRLAFAFVVLAASSACAADAPGDPTQFVQGLYKSYGADNSGAVLGKKADAIFSAPLLAEIRADQRAHEGEAGKLDHDPICNCQDPDGLVLSHLKVSAAQAGKASAEVVVRLGRQEKSVTLDLAQTRDGWRVDDIATAATPSLRRFLATP